MMPDLDSAAAAASNIEWSTSRSKQKRVTSVPYIRQISHLCYIPRLCLYRPWGHRKCWRLRGCRWQPERKWRTRRRTNDRCGNPERSSEQIPRLQWIMQLGSKSLLTSLRSSYLCLLQSASVYFPSAISKACNLQIKPMRICTKLAFLYMGRA